MCQVVMSNDLRHDLYTASASSVLRLASSNPVHAERPLLNPSVSIALCQWPDQTLPAHLSNLVVVYVRRVRGNRRGVPRSQRGRKAARH